MIPNNGSFRNSKYTKKIEKPEFAAKSPKKIEKDDERMKRTVKPIKGDTVESYWRKCEGKFSYNWYQKSCEYIVKNGGEFEKELINNCKTVK